MGPKYRVLQFNSILITQLDNTHLKNEAGRKKNRLERRETKDRISQNDSFRKHVKLAWELGLNLASDITGAAGII